ncbi:hypothetical protein JKF63_02509 [Porcisia hertigi]|uniref:TRAF3-interacting protein 1 n=1 Tax=Porcisia hertigi TaxID=2761500 RepID=A0A836LDL8_9TRYP|nr:hypothetical protein JKF63_02509 [Porcisia hertigi]
MSDEVDFWSATISAYEPLQLPAPQLTPKLLKKPPFRFIHDIVCNIDARFAAYDHMIPVDLRDSAQVNTKEKKIEYLTTLIQYINKLMKVELDVNPKKIVSGHEPEKTNIFLQYLAAGVGYAQQDKAAQAASPSKAKSDYSTSSSPSGTAITSSTRDTQANHTLPSPTSPAQKKLTLSDPAVYLSSRIAAFDAATRFDVKLSGYSMDLKPRDDVDVRAEGESIVRMWKELANPQVETQPSKMQSEALETAIDRQLETIKMVRALLDENDGIIEKLEALVS